jgi:hypothetical protein
MGKLIRNLREGSSPGKDIYASKRIVFKYLGDEYSWKKLTSNLPFIRNKFISSFTKSVNKARIKSSLPQNGIMNNTLLEKMRAAGAVDSYSDKLLQDYAKEQLTKIVEPYQGFSSLHKSLWEVYSIGRNMGLKDGPGLASGTYNPGSRLPSGKKSDHAHLPSYAFDLDIVQYTGWNNLNARAYFNKIINRPEINYAILGNKIWSKSNGLNSYNYGGHENHIHISAVH